VEATGSARGKRNRQRLGPGVACGPRKKTAGSILILRMVARAPGGVARMSSRGSRRNGLSRLGWAYPRWMMKKGAVAMQAKLDQRKMMEELAASRGFTEIRHPGCTGKIALWGFSVGGGVGEHLDVSMARFLLSAPAVARFYGHAGRPRRIVAKSKRLYLFPSGDSDKSRGQRGMARFRGALRANHVNSARIYTKKEQSTGFHQRPRPRVMTGGQQNWRAWERTLWGVFNKKTCRWGRVGLYLEARLNTGEDGLYLEPAHY